MNPKIFIVSLLIILLTACSGLVDEKEAIKNVYSQYHEAIYQHDGQRVIQLVDKKTVQYYDHQREYALTTRKAELKEYPLLIQLSILLMRNHYSRSELEKFDAENFFVNLVQNGQLDSIQNIEFAEIMIHPENSNIAYGYAHQQETIPSAIFVKESNQWKLALANTLTQKAAQLERELAESKISDEDFIMNAFRKSRKNVDKKIWDGPIK